MDTIRIYTESLTLTQIVIVTGCVSFFLMILSQNIWFVASFGASVYVGYLVANFFSRTTNVYNSAFLLKVVDAVNCIQYLKKRLFHIAIKDTSSKLDCIRDSDVEKEVETMVRFIVRDFVHSWYSEITNEEVFTSDIKHLLNSSALDILKRLSELDKFTLIEEFTKLFHQHLIDFQAACDKLKQQPKYRYKKDRQREFSKIGSVEEAFESMGLYHIALENRDSEIKYLQCIADSIIKLVFPDEVFACHAVKEIVINIVTCQVLIVLVDMVSQPYWLHIALILLLSNNEPDIINKETLQAEMSDQSQSSSVPACEQFIDTTQSDSVCLTQNAAILTDASQEEKYKDYDILTTCSERLPPIGASLVEDSLLESVMGSDESSNTSQQPASIVASSQHQYVLTQPRFVILGSLFSLYSLLNSFSFIFGTQLTRHRLLQRHKNIQHFRNNFHLFKALNGRTSWRKMLTKLNILINCVQCTNNNKN